MFLDASSIVAILAEEESAAILLDKIGMAKGPIYYSSLGVFEAVVSIARQRKMVVYGELAPTPAHMIEEVQAVVDIFLERIGAVEIGLPASLHQIALTAAKSYGRFVGHPAKLNFGDCFSYAAAKSLKSPLLYVGNDFSQTDIEAA